MRGRPSWASGSAACWKAASACRSFHSRNTITRRTSRWFASASSRERRGAGERPVPPLFTPFQLRGLTLRNRTRAANYDKFYQNVFPGSAVSAADTLSIMKCTWPLIRSVIAGPLPR